MNCQDFTGFYMSFLNNSLGQTQSPFLHSYKSLNINAVKLSQTQSNHAYWGGDSLSPQPSTLPLPAPARQNEAEQSHRNPRRAPAQTDVLVYRKYAVKPSRTQSNHASPLQAACRHSIPPPDAPNLMKTPSPPPFVIRHFTLGALCPLWPNLRFICGHLWPKEKPQLVNP